MLIELDSVTKIFASDLLTSKVTALDSVSFAIHKGEITGFLGANGAGKTTSIKIIFDFLRATSGHVHYAKELGGKGLAARAKMGFVSERPYIPQDLSGRDFLLYIGKLRSLSRAQLNQLIKKWSERLSIDHALDRPARSYSKGMLQRLSIASALLHSPELLILDEPLSGLDPMGRKEIKDLFLELASEGKALFFSSHVVSDVEEVCKRVVVLEKGRLLYFDEISKLLNDAKVGSELISLEELVYKIGKS